MSTNNILCFFLEKQKNYQYFLAGIRALFRALKLSECKEFKEKRVSTGLPQVRCLFFLVFRYSNLGLVFACYLLCSKIFLSSKFTQYFNA